ncbi:acetyl-CoA carboxylase carboxyltransferase subunit alpha, partial [Nguyenibacter vanlangensis]
MRQFLDFEKPVAELEDKIDELRKMSGPDGINLAEEIARLTDKADKQLRAAYAKLTPWQKVQVARHAQRPHAVDYIGTLIEDFTPLAGDRLFAEDKAVVGGLGRFQGRPVVVIGTERGADLDTRLEHNFGMARPEGYRKAQRLMDLAGRFDMPILTFIDTAGAWPGIDAEARGQAEAIARSIDLCLAAPVPVIATVIGEGGSGGAVALGAGDRVMMLEHAIYSVISPEACASILWRDPKQATSAADALKLTAQDLLQLGLIDRIIPEPLGGAQRDPEATIRAVGDAI